MESTDSSQQPELPPGFRFHPSDEELVVHYLKKKAASAPLPVPIIAELDLYKFDPWELPAKAIFGEQEWYFFSPRERKYPNGMRPNRAATSGYWKATGTDKPVLTAGGTHKVGVKKALVFYGGKPPKGIKTNWIMHEYRLLHNTNPLPLKPSLSPSSLRLDDWVLCRIYKKNKAQLEMPMDQESDGHIIMCIGQHKFVENDTLMNDPQLHLMPPHNPAKRSTLYWNDGEGNANSPSTKRTFLAENSESNTIFSQLPPQTPPLLGDEVFGQDQYQVPGVNWYP